MEANNETLIVKRGSGDGAVIISMKEYNSLMETVHLLKSLTNAAGMYESLEQMKGGDVHHVDSDDYLRE